MKEEKEEDEEEEEDKEDEEEEDKEDEEEEGGSLSKISSEETLSKLRLKLNQNKAHPQNTPGGRRINNVLIHFVWAL